MKGNIYRYLVDTLSDRPGILAAVTNLSTVSGKYTLSYQYVNKEEKVFFMRVEWDLKDFRFRGKRSKNFSNTLLLFDLMFPRLYFADEVPRMAILFPSCPLSYDNLARYAAGEWKVEIPLIISNHKDLEPVAKRFGIDFYTFSINEKNKAEQEALELQLLKEKKVTFCVLARYMQILSPEFIQHYPNKIINIHHSFLPAFAGSKPIMLLMKRSEN
jgi:formyltetrahydrofolate deformylase